MRIISALLLHHALAFSLGGVAQQPPPALPAITPPNHFHFAGDWECDGTFKNGKVHRARFALNSILDGRWLEMTEQDVQPATGYSAKYLIGYDPQHKRLIEFDANTFGAAVYYSEQGWSDTHLTMTSPPSHESNTGYAADRFVYSIIGQDRFTVDWQISKTAVLDWIQSDHLACKRRS